MYNPTGTVHRTQVHATADVGTVHATAGNILATTAGNMLPRRAIADLRTLMRHRTCRCTDGGDCVGEGGDDDSVVDGSW